MSGDNARQLDVTLHSRTSRDLVGHGRLAGESVMRLGRKDRDLDGRVSSRSKKSCLRCHTKRMKADRNRSEIEANDESRLV